MLPQILVIDYGKLCGIRREDGIYGQVFLPIRDQVWLEIDNPKKLKIKKWKG
jgi:hypothetical protein